MKKSIQSALNTQLKHEYESSYIYLAMAAYFAEEGFNGLSAWMKKQSTEELVHAHRFFDFINENNGAVSLQAIAAPKANWKSVKAVFEAGLAHEKLITDSINKLIDLAVKEKDHGTHHFLLGFATEQVEEENIFRDIVRKLRLLGENPTGLLMVDRELGGR